MSSRPIDKRIFCNRSLRMDDIEWVGFDMDYTLAIYRQQAMDDISIRATVEKLVARGYPKAFKEVGFPTTFPIRGLVIDKELGNILKLDGHKYVKHAYHGLSELSRDVRRELYDVERPKLATDRFHWVDTLYALSEVAIFARGVEILDARDRKPDYLKLFTDVRECIDLSHQDGSILGQIMADPGAFINADAELPSTLHRLRSSGKKVFLLTNSWPQYTSVLMTYLLGDKRKEYDDWSKYFDLVITGARKPAFFTERNPFKRWDGQNFEEVDRLRRGEIYFGGNIATLTATLGTTGDHVLYVGDHIYGDVLRAKKESAWRTIMVIQELHHELSSLKASTAEIHEVDDLTKQREALVDALRSAQNDISELKHAGEDVREAKSIVEQTRAGLSEVDEKLEALERTIADRFHPQWGSLLKTHGEVSSFGKQVEDWACLYTSRVTNLNEYTASHYFRSPRELMPHELLSELSSGMDVGA